MKTIKFAALATAAFLLAANAGATTVRVHYDAGKGSIAIVGDKGPMSWSKRAAAKSGAGHVWNYSWPDQPGDVTMKPALGDKLSTGGACKLAAGSSIDIYPFFGAPFGKVSIMPGFESPQLKNSRSLPPDRIPEYTPCCDPKHGGGLEDTTLMRDAMLAQGYRAGAELFYYSAAGGSHNEKSWAARVDKPLAWLFPWGSTRY